jgi:hypothetical protein
VLELYPEDAEAKERRLALRRRLHQLSDASRQPAAHQQRTTTGGGRPAPAPEVKRLTVADIRAMAARTKAELAATDDDDGASAAAAEQEPPRPEPELAPEQERAFDAIVRTRAICRRS